jgi:GNAT superfamily N-acetyltransferase
MQIPHDAPTLIEPGRPLHIVEVGRAHLDVIRQLNRVIFDEERIINTFDRDDLLMLLASLGDEPVGFKIGYKESRDTFYSAKGGVLAGYRRQGISRRLLYAMIDRIHDKGYRILAFDTFPNIHPGMTILGLVEGFRVTRADYNPTYKDFRLRFEKRL